MKLWHVFQLSFGGSSPVLSDRKRYRYFYRMGTPDQKYIMARIELMKKYGWTKVASIQQAVEFFSVVCFFYLNIELPTCLSVCLSVQLLTCICSTPSSSFSVLVQHFSLHQPPSLSLASRLPNKLMEINLSTETNIQKDKKGTM